GFFATILITSSTSVDINFALWYLYPLFYIFIPFLFYTIFKKFSEKSKSKNFISIVFMIFIVFTPQFIKYGHATGTGVLGVLVYFILVLELFNLIHNRNFNFKNILLIVILYFFLCLTHTEESIYFLVLMILYYIYHLFCVFKKSEKSILDINSSANSMVEETLFFKQVFNIELTIKRTRRSFVKFGFLFFSLIMIFYLTNEFFGYFPKYLSMSVGKISYLNFIYDEYSSNCIKIPFFLRGNLNISIFIIHNLIAGTLLFLFLIYILFFKMFHIIQGVYNKGVKFFKKICLFIIKLISKPIIQILFLIFSVFLIIYLDQFILSGSVEISLITILIPVISYLFLILQIFLFIKGIEYYQLKNHRQNFFLLSILISSIIMMGLVIVGDLWLAVYVFHTKFSSYFVFFNLIIIQNTYFKALEKRKKKIIIVMIIIALILGIFYSLRKLTFG
ncbi:MAG: hypothetical protein V3V33_02405, partial [Candidatus Lokiarchaeia archaeon]